MENPVSHVENIVEVQNTRNDKNKALENLIIDEYAPINVVPTLEIGFVNKAIKIFI